MFIVDHPFDRHTFDSFVGMSQPPGHLSDWATDDTREFVRLRHFFKPHENFLWLCLRVSVPQESPSIFVTSNTCDALFSLKTCGHLQTAKQIMSIADCKTDYQYYAPMQPLTPFTWVIFRPPKPQTSEFRWRVSEKYHQWTVQSQDWVLLFRHVSVLFFKTFHASGTMLWVYRGQCFECITSTTDSMKFKVRLLDKMGVPPCYK